MKITNFKAALAIPRVTYEELDKVTVDYDGKWYAVTNKKRYLITNCNIEESLIPVTVYSLPSNTNHVSWSERQTSVSDKLATYINGGWSKLKPGMIVSIKTITNDTCTI